MSTPQDSFGGPRPAGAGPDSAATGQDETTPGSAPLRRPARGRVVAGVAAAIAAHFGFDVTIARIGFAVLTIVGFTGIAHFGGIPLFLGGIPLYAACWLLIPAEGSDRSVLAGLLQHSRPRP